MVGLSSETCVDQYAKVEELLSGPGMADVVFLPKRRAVLPAMIVELKGNQAAEGAIQQINDRKYPKVLENYDGEIVLVGVSYDEKNKKHECRIEKHKKWVDSSRSNSLSFAGTKMICQMNNVEVWEKDCLELLKMKRWNR